MKTLILAAALAVTALVGIAQANNYCQQTCRPDGFGGYTCTTHCW